MKTNWLNFILIILLCLGCNSSEKKASPELITSIEKGSEIYQNFCINCHMANGEGIENVYPPLASSDYLKNNLKSSIRSVKYGVNGEMVVNGKTYNNIMAPMGLSDEEVANVINYVNNSWGNKNTSLITPEEVSKIQPK